MFKIKNLKLYLFIACFVLIFVPSVNGSDLDDILKDIEAGEDALIRLRAQRALYKHLEDISETERSQDVKKLLDSLRRPDSSYKYPHRYKVGVYEGIGRMRKFFWEVEGQEEEKSKLYKHFKKEKDYTLKKSIENALMTARGLYWDAINDYNENRVNAPDLVARKFCEVFESYPASEYAPKAHYFLARYYIKVYFILKDNNENPSADEWIARKSNNLFKDFIKKVECATYKKKRKLEAGYKKHLSLDFETKNLQEARYYMSLNFVLLKKFDKTREQLEKIINDSKKKDRTIYIDQFYFSKETYKPKRYILASYLAEETLEYLNESIDYDNENYLQLFIKHLNTVMKGWRRIKENP
ncbi:MAG: hypothetical protein KAS04_05585 [Candidatus Aenigmarchaeota archaeon]|nr:hypothetical protein [Candidatus Aenigmarchaeota archaeon]